MNQSTAKQQEFFLEQAWQSLTAQYQPAADLWVELKHCYSEPSRHYHTLQHIYQLFILAAQYQAHITDPEIVRWAIFYHDLVYNVFRRDNERKSAFLAGKRLEEIGVPQARRHEVMTYIEATARHEPVAVTHPADLALFLDFDMAILGAPPPQYQWYTAQVRKEYAVYPAMVYKPGRRQFLEHLLEADSIFLTPLFKDLYERQARQNIENELKTF